MLFDEADARESLPKAVAAERHLRAINAGAAVEGVVADLTPANAEDLLAGHDIILDGADNFETRFLVNDVPSNEASAGFMRVWWGAMG